MELRGSFARQGLLGLGLFTGIVGVGFMVLGRGKAKEATAPEQGVPMAAQGATQIIEIRTAPVTLSGSADRVDAAGQVLYPQDSTVKVSPRAQGRIRSVFVHVGETVRSGQPLALLDSADAGSATTAVRQNSLKLELARRTLERQRRLFRLGTPDVTAAESALEQAHARTRFTKGVAARIRTQAEIGGFSDKPLEDARAAVAATNGLLAQARSDLAQAARDSGRKQRLVDIGVSARSDLEAALNVREKAEAAVQAAGEQVALARQALRREEAARKSNLYADQNVRAAESDYQQALLQESSAQRQLRLARTAVLRDLNQAESDKRAAEYDLENARSAAAMMGAPTSGGSVLIRAPIGGVITERNVNPGQVVDQSQMTPWQMFTITNSARVWIDADVFEKDVASVRVGLPVQIRVVAIPGRIFNGRVLHIAPAMDPKTHGVKMRAELPNPGGMLKEGMFANVSIRIGHSRARPVVPLASIQHGPDHDYVFVAAGKAYTKRPVTIVRQTGDTAEIADGVRPGERVVTDGAMFITATSAESGN